MDLTMGMAGALALVMALILMYAVLKRYTYPAVEEPFFSDPTLFKMFTVGLVEGTILLVAYTYLIPWYTVAGLGLVIAVLFGAVTELTKSVTLNLRRFSGRSDTVFYGFGLGLGIGTAMGFGLIYYLTSRSAVDTASWAIILVLAVQNILLHSGTGIRVGEGVARRRNTEFLMLALFVNVVFQALLAPLFSLSSSDDLYWLAYLSMAAALVLVAANLRIMVSKKLPRIVEDVLESEGKKRKDIPGL